METPVFKSTLNTRAVLDGSLRYIRSDVPTAVSPEEAEWLLRNAITAVIDLRSDCEREKKPCPLMADARFSYRCLPITGGVFAWTAVIIAVSVLFEKLFLRLTDRVLRKVGNIHAD